MATAGNHKATTSTSSTSKRSPNASWQRAVTKILRALDLRTEYEAIGIEIVSSSPNAAGWLECHAIDRDDNRPSAAINVSGEDSVLGRYKDSGGNQDKTISFLEFAAQHDPQFGGNWTKARDHYAEKTGVELPKRGKGKNGKKSGGKSKNPNDRLTFEPWNDSLAKIWTVHPSKQGISTESLELAAARFAKWPAGKSGGQKVVAVPAYGPGLLGSEPTGWVIWPFSHLPFPIRQAAGYSTHHKVLSLGNGWIGHHCFSKLSEAAGLSGGKEAGAARDDSNASPPPTIIWKTEGPTDLLALLSAIPPDLRDTHLAFTNACGANEGINPKLAAHLANIVNAPVVIVHDADKAGESGGDKWGQGLAQYVEDVRRVRLPYEISEDHGKDLRDWFAEGHTYNELLAMANGEGVVRYLGDWSDLLRSNEPTSNDLPTTDSNNAPPSNPTKPSTAPSTTPTTFEQPLSNAQVGLDGESTNPLTMQKVVAQIFERTGGWPKRVGESLFIHDDKTNDVHWIKNAPSLFGWLAERCGVIEWHSKKTGCVTKEEVFYCLKRVAENFVAVESLPHEPRIPGHYYACEFPESADGNALTELLDRFCPATEVDRELILAMFATLFWGGRGGSRPAFVITATTGSGRGTGKSKITDVIGHLVGGIIEISANADDSVIRQRLLSKGGVNKRIARLDNVKSHRFSWAELESMITSPVISGKEMYVGESSRPNTVTWLITLNGVSLSTDMAQRSVVIEIDKPRRTTRWEESIMSYIDEHRQAIIGDILAVLRLEPFELSRTSRWSMWEGGVLSRVNNPDDCQEMILKRSGESDAEAEEVEAVEEFFAMQLESYNYYPEASKVHIPSSIAAEWYNRAMNEKKNTMAAGKILRQFAKEGRTKRLFLNPSRTYGRGFLWNGSNEETASEANEADYDLTERIERRKQEERMYRK